MSKENNSYETLMALDPSKDFTVYTNPDDIEKKSVAHHAHPDYVKDSLMKNIKDYKEKRAQEKAQKAAAAEIANDLEEISTELDDRNINDVDFEEKVEPIVAATIADSAINTKENSKDESEKDNK